MLSWAQDYKGVYGMEIVGRKYLVVTDPSLLPGVVGRGSRGLPKSDGYSMWDPAISPHPGVQGLFTVAENNDTWRTVRRAYGPAMGPGTMGYHYPIILRCTTKLGRAIASLGRGGEAALEFNCLLKALTLDMLCLSAFGIDLGFLDEPQGSEMQLQMERALYECGQRARSVGRRLLPWLYEEERRRGEESFAALHALGQQIWATIQARGPPAEDDYSFGAQLARLADPSRGSEALSEEQILAEICTLVLAGYEATANTMTWMLFSLVAYPEATTKLEEELRNAGILGAAAAAHPGSDTDLDPTAATLAALPGGHEALLSLPYLDAFVRENLRRFPMAPNGLIKQVPAAGPPARVGPYEVTPGTVVWVPFWGLHLSEDNWERPLEFLPERWIGRDPQSAGDLSASRCPVSAAVGAIRSAASAAPTATSHSPSPSPFPGSSSSSSASTKAIRYMPFGDGSRRCVGQHLALLELKTVVAYVVGRFRLELDPGRMVDVETVLERQRVNLTLEVEGGMWLRANPRGPA